MRHRRHAAGIGRLQLVHKAHDAAEFLDHAVDLAGTDLEAGEVGNVFHILTGQFHGSRTIESARRKTTGAEADNTLQLLNPTLVARLASFCFSSLADRGASC
jgi:hypothetical protein